MALAAFNLQVTDYNGRAVPLAMVEVRRMSAGLPIASIFSNRSGSTPLANPVRADALGYLRFHARGGAYQIRAYTTGGFEKTWQYVPMGLAAETDGLISWQGEVANVGALPAEGEPGEGYIVGGVPYVWTEIDGWVELETPTVNIGTGAARGAAASRLLDGEEGFAARFDHRSFACNDFSGNKSALGSPDDYFASVRATGGGYWDRDRLYKYAGLNALRYEHDPLTGAPLGLLVEGTRTNLCLRSEELDNAAWTKTNATITANQRAGRDGAVTMDRIVVSSASFPRCAQNFNLTSGTTYVFSLDVAAGDVIYLQGTLNNAGNTQLRRFYLRMDTGVTALSTLTGTLALAATAVQLPNGLWRLIVTATPTTTEAYTFFFGPADAMSSNTGTVATYIHAGAVQVEVGPYMSSYTGATAGSSVTRNGDDISLAASAVPINAAQGSLYAEVSMLGIPLVSTFPGFGLNVSPAVNANSSIGFGCTNGGVIYGLIRHAATALDFSSNLVAATFVPGTFYKLSTSWRNQFGAADHANVRGATIGTSSDADTLPPVDKLNLHQCGNPFFGIIKSVMVRTRRQPNAEMTTLTT